MPGVEREEVFDADGASRRDVQNVRCPRAECGRVRRTEGFRFREDFRPCNRGFNKAAGLYVFINGREYGLSFGGRDPFAEDGEPDRVPASCRCNGVKASGAL